VKSTEQIGADVLAFLHRHGRATIAELVFAVYGVRDQRAKRDAVARAVNMLEADGKVTSTMEPVRNARGRQMPQRVVYLGADAAEARPPVTDDGVDPALLAPGAPAICDSDGHMIAADERASHLYQAEQGLAGCAAPGCVWRRDRTPESCTLHRPCDDECKRYGCVQPVAPTRGRWIVELTPTQQDLWAMPAVREHYAAYPDPVIVLHDGQAGRSEWLAALPGCSISDVVQAWHTEHGTFERYGVSA
jgi:hypothetical protein